MPPFIKEAAGAAFAASATAGAAVGVFAATGFSVGFPTEAFYTLKTSDWSYLDLPAAASTLMSCSDWASLAISLRSAFFAAESASANP